MRRTECERRGYGVDIHTALRYVFKEVSDQSIEEFLVADSLDAHVFYVSFFLGVQGGVVVYVFLGVCFEFFYCRCIVF